MTIMTIVIKFIITIIIASFSITKNNNVKRQKIKKNQMKNQMKNQIKSQYG